jgi:predicted enzyme related to lactoylglutathione lyase
MADDSLLAYVEFPSDDPERARRFWEGLLDVQFSARGDGEGEGWQTSGSAGIGLHSRGGGPGDRASLPWFRVDDMTAAADRVRTLGGEIIHAGEQFAVCRDSEGSPFGLAAAGTDPG